MKIKLEGPIVKLGDLKPGDCFRGDGSNDFNSHPDAIGMVVETRECGISYMWLHSKPVVVRSSKYEEYKHRTVLSLGRLTTSL